jgi:hypothetical protein
MNTITTTGNGNFTWIDVRDATIASQAAQIERLRKAVKLAIELHLECLVDFEEYGLTCSVDIYPFYEAALQLKEGE